MSDTVKRIKELTKSLAGDAEQLAKQAEAGFKSQWMSVDDSGEAKWGGTPGIYYGTVGLPALADLAKEGTAPEWAKEADEKAGKIRSAVERKMGIEEPKGFPQHLARAAGEMVAQVPVPGAMMNKLRTAKLAVNEAPSLKRKIALSPLEYFSPIVEVGKPKPTAINYGVGTAFGGGLGYGIEKLTDDTPSLGELISKYGPNYGSEVRDVSKPKQFSKGGDVEDEDRIPDLPPSPTEEDIAEYRRKTKKYDDRQYWKRRGPNSADEDTSEKARGDEAYPMLWQLHEKYDKYSMPYLTDDDIDERKRLRYYAGGGRATKLKQGRSAFFSAVDKAISTLKQEKGTPEQMMSLIEKTPGVKKEELERRGIRKKLEGKKSVTRAELEAIAKERPAQAPIITRLKDRYTLEDMMEKLKDDTGLDDLAIQNIETKLGLKFDYHNAYGLRVKDSEGSLYNLNDLKKIVEDYRYANDISETEAKDLLNDINKIDPYFDPLPGPKYPSYSLKGLANKPVDYQEVIMSMPTRMQQLREFAKQRGITNIQEAERAWEQEYGQLLPEDEYIGHWKSIPVANTVVHYRAQSFIDKDGKKVFHVEEVQSDPHQKARDARKDEVKKRVENEKDRRFRKLAQQLDDDPNFLPEGYDFYDINPSGEMGGETGVGIFNTRTGKDLGGIEGFDEDESVERLKKKFKSKLRAALKKQVDLSDDEIKAIAKEVPEDFGYKTSDKEAKAKEIDDKLRQIREDGLGVDEIEEYFQPGKIVKSWSGTDKVLGFQRGPKPGSDEWQQEYNKALAYARQNYLGRDDDAYYDIATRIANNKANEWQVQVVEIDPATGREIGAPRWHATSPLEQIRNELRQQKADLGGVISDLPYKKTYDELALKQIIDDAVNQGYDRVSISPGLFQVDRYQSAIRSKIDSIEWGPLMDDDDDERLIRFIKNGSSVSDVVVNDKGKVTQGPNEWIGEPLKNIIGEDMANKIIAAPESGQLSGEGLTIGAKGFVEFYDKRLPNFLREYLRKEFGADTGRTEFEYDMGEKEKSRYAIEQDLANRWEFGELTEQELSDIEEHIMDDWYQSFNVRARSNGLDPEDIDVEMQAFNDEGVFEGLREQSERRALNMYAQKLYKAQPDIRPKADVFSFDITPEMSEKVKTQGQRLFAAAPVVALPMAQDDAQAEDKRKVSPSYTIAPEAKTPTLTPQEEQQFQSDVRGTDWFSRFKEKFGEEPNLEDKEYNYRAAWKSGARPQAIEQDDIPHWPSVTSSGESLKARSHPSGWMEDYIQITGRDPSEGGELTPEQIDAMNKSLMYRYGFAGGGRASKINKLRKLLAEQAPEQADPIIEALKRTGYSKKEHSVIGLSDRGGKGVVTPGTEKSVKANKFDLRVSRQDPSKAPIVDFHTHPGESGHVLNVAPSEADLTFYASQYPYGREIRTIIATPPDKIDAFRRRGTAYNYFATDKADLSLNPHTYNDALYELQTARKKGLLDAALNDPLIRQYIDDNPELLDELLVEASPLLLQKYFANKGKGKHELQLSGQQIGHGYDETDEAIFQRLETPSLELLKSKKFAGGGRASKVKQVLKKMGVDESKVADKDLVTLQDFHTSLGDRIRERAAKMQQQMDAMKFKYEPGQRVFTESSAKKNWLPYEIKQKRLAGGNPVRETPISKASRDPETGEVLREPIEPGYLVRHDHGDGTFSEYVLPESAIKGSIDEFAKGGLAKKIRELRQKIANATGEYNAKRFDRAADEVPSLETTFSNRALSDAFIGNNTTGLAVINPADYEKYATSLPKHGYDETHAGPVYRIGGKAVTYDEYIKYLQNIANTKGFRNVPLLGIDKNKENLLTILMHEGRHRQRALSGLGDTKSLIQVFPGSSIKEQLPKRTREESIEAVKSAISKKPAISQDTLRNYKPGQVLTDDELIILPEIFKHGGSV